MLVGGFTPSEIYEFVNWDDYSIPNISGQIIQSCSSHHQPGWSSQISLFRSSLQGSVLPGYPSPSYRCRCRWRSGTSRHRRHPPWRAKISTPGDTLETLLSQAVGIWTMATLFGHWKLEENMGKRWTGRTGRAMDSGFQKFDRWSIFGCLKLVGIWDCVRWDVEALTISCF